MGMFDDIKYEAPCHKCGATLTRWQSKDGPCELLTLAPEDVDEFYTNCECGAWNQYRVEKHTIHILKEIVPNHREPSW